MRKSILLFICLFIFTLSYSQQKQVTFKKYYKIPDQIEKVKLKVEEEIKYENFTPEQKKELHEKYKIGDTLYISYSEVINGKSVTINKMVIIDQDFYDKQTLTVDNDVSDTIKRKGYVKFDEEEGRIYVNPWLKRKEGTGEFTDRDDIYYYELDNRQSIKLCFQEISVSTFTIPLKYRFKDKEQGLKEDFTSSLNVNLFAGYGFGKTRFLHRKKVGVKTYTDKITIGAFFGASTIELNSSNTSLDSTPLADDVTISKGIVNIGFGGIYNIRNISLGLFYGWDYAIGDSANKWNYNKEPWLGIGVGYEIF